LRVLREFNLITQRETIFNSIVGVRVGNWLQGRTEQTKQTKIK
tara:strand:+ start:2269 stop:2397 length:129 start_codon:yes stop_codon:yes gene_type:complete